MSEIIKSTRLLIFTYFIRLALLSLPKDCDATLQWIAKMPLEE